MDTILLFLIFACLFMYVIFALWQITIVCGPTPENGSFHTQIELEVNWNTNRPPILFSLPWLSFLVGNNFLFYWVASILGIILVYLKTSSLLSMFFAALLFFIGAFVSLRILKLIVLIRIKKHWRN